MLRTILIILFMCSFSVIQAQTVRDFRLGTWGMFPWIEPTDHEQELLELINANHINAWILNPNDNVYPFYNDPAIYPDFSTSNIRWLERAWMDYLDSTGTIGMYVGYNGSKTSNQSNSQIEYFASNTWIALSSFKTVFNNYLNDFGSDAGLQGYYVSTEDIDESSTHSRIDSMLAYIRNSDPNHELVIEHYDLGANNWAANNTDKYDIFERTFYVFEDNDPYASSSHQADLTDLINRANNNMSNLTGTEVDWHAIIQTYAYEPVSSTNTSEAKRRWPTREEMYASAYLCLSRGARGINVFLYGSTVKKNTAGVKIGEFHGLLTDDFTTNERPKQQTTINGNTVKPFDYVKDLFTELKVIKDVFPQIEVEDAYTASAASSSKYVTTTGNWIEAGVFHNRVQTAINEKYILLVNRVCNNANGSPASNQAITVTLNENYSGKRVVEDLYKTYTSGIRDETATLNSGENSFTITIGPGRGLLLQINYPPTIPQNFAGSWDNGNEETGHPKLTWTANTEMDLKEYEVWKKVDDWWGNNIEPWAKKTSTTNTSYVDNSEIGWDYMANPRVVYYKIRAIDQTNNASGYTATQRFDCNNGPHGYSAKGELVAETTVPKSFKLQSNYPNPFNPVTSIRYALPEASSVVLNVYNLSGQKVATLQNGLQQAGRHTARFDGSSLASGIYIYRFSAMGQKSGKRFNAVKRMLLIK